MTRPVLPHPEGPFGGVVRTRDPGCISVSELGRGSRRDRRVSGGASVDLGPDGLGVV